MAISREDKGDVKNAMGKALANKVSKVTKDRFASTNALAKRNRENQKHLKIKAGTYRKHSLENYKFTMKPMLDDADSRKR